jgi:hypothetical protein
MIIDIEPISLGISLAAIVAFIAPIYISKKKQSNINKSKQQKFMDEANRQGIVLDNYDFWRGTYAIGLDTGKHKLLYMDLEAEINFKLISTDNISHIDLQKQNHHLGKGSNKLEVIDRLSLMIHHKEPAVRKSHLCFFDGEKKSDLSGEWPLIQKWNALLIKEMAAT